jgi:hypothetical protein
MIENQYDQKQKEAHFAEWTIEDYFACILS